MWGWLAAIVRGFADSFLASWQQYQHGRTAQQRDDANATLGTERKIAEALAKDDADRPARDRAVADLVRRNLAGPAAPDDRAPRG